MHKNLALLLLGLTLSGCAAPPRKIAVKVAAAEPAPTPAAPEPPPALTAPSPVPAPMAAPQPEDPGLRQVRDLMDRASSLFDEGELLMRRGQVEDGKKRLRQAIDLIHASPLSAAQYPQLELFQKDLGRD